LNHNLSEPLYFGSFPTSFSHFYITIQKYWYLRQPWQTTGIGLKKKQENFPVKISWWLMTRALKPNSLI
jgi:hypothetical protein